MTQTQPSTSLPYEEALREVKTRVAASGTSFAAGMALLPRKRREAMYALYAFCREVDDIADDSPDAATRRKGLTLWRARLRALFAQGEPSEAITAALAPAIPAYGLVEEDFQEIVEGMEMDAAQTIFAPTLDELDLYCERVASAVGRASVRIFGDASPSAMNVAKHLGRALQLTNILRDLAEDAARGRLYLPRELLQECGPVPKTSQEALASPSLPCVCRKLAVIAGEHFTLASASMQSCNERAMRPARAMMRYYRALYDQLLKNDWQNPQIRVRLPFWRKLLIAFQGLLD